MNTLYIIECYIECINGEFIIGRKAFWKRLEALKAVEQLNKLGWAVQRKEHASEGQEIWEAR